MVTLKDLKSNKVYVDLAYLADLLETTRLSKTIPIDSENRLSLPFALALICGAQKGVKSDDFEQLLRNVPALNRSHFILCWEVIELEVEEDIVVWSESVGTEETVRVLRNISKVIEHS